MPFRGTENRRSEEHKNAQALARQILKHPKLKGKLYGKLYGKSTVEIEVITAREEQTPKEVIRLKPIENPLSKAEKRALHKKLSGSAKHFSYKGLKESDRIANREEWEENTK